jgi:hypothetical protein
VPCTLKKYLSRANEQMEVRENRFIKLREITMIQSVTRASVKNSITVHLGGISLDHQITSQASSAICRNESALTDATASSGGLPCAFARPRSDLLIEIASPVLGCASDWMSLRENADSGARHSLVVIGILLCRWTDNGDCLGWYQTF